MKHFAFLAAVVAATLLCPAGALGAPMVSVSASPTLQAAGTPTLAPTPQPKKPKVKKQKKDKSKGKKKLKKVKAQKTKKVRKIKKAFVPPAGTLPAPPPVPDECITDTTPGIQSLPCEGLTFRLSVPPLCSSAACGLIFDVHGFAMTGEIQDLHTNLAALGAASGYIVVQPSAPIRNGLPRWQAGDDVAVRAFMERVIAAYHVQPERVHFTGYSQGGWMTWRFACHAADLLASVAPLAAGGQASGEGCFQSDFPATELDVFYVHGTTDNFVPFSSAQPMIDGITGLWDMEADSIVSSDAAHVWTRYLNDEGTTFEFARHDWETALVFGTPLLGHCFPGSGELIGCGVDTAFHWGTEVLNFFIEHPRD